jgi:histidinol dehydrogenase
MLRRQKAPDLMPARATDAAGEVLMPVGQADALQQVEIHVLRQMGDNIAAQTRAMERLTGKVDDVRERVIRLEERKTDAALEAVQEKLDTALERIDQLERMRDEAKGASSVWVFLSKNAGWLFAGAAAFIAGLAVKAGFVK